MFTTSLSHGPAPGEIGAPTLFFDTPPPMLKNPIFAVCNDAEAAGREPLFPSRCQDQVVEVERKKKSLPFLIKETARAGLQKCQHRASPSPCPRAPHPLQFPARSAASLCTITFALTFTAGPHLCEPSCCSAKWARAASMERFFLVRHPPNFFLLPRAKI